MLERVRQSALAAGVAVEAVLEEGVPHEAILRRARAADLLVLGRSGEAHGDGFGGLGSTADRVLRASPVPVLLAPGEPVGSRAPFWATTPRRAPSGPCTPSPPWPGPWGLGSGW